MKLGCWAGAPRAGSVPGLCLILSGKALGQAPHLGAASWVSGSGCACRAVFLPVLGPLPSRALACPALWASLSTPEPHTGSREVPGTPRAPRE